MQERAKTCKLLPKFTKIMQQCAKTSFFSPIKQPGSSWDIGFYWTLAIPGTLGHWLFLGTWLLLGGATSGTLAFTGHGLFREQWLLGYSIAAIRLSCNFFSTLRSISVSFLTSLQGYGMATFSRLRKPPSAIIFVFGGFASSRLHRQTHTTLLTAADTRPNTNTIWSVSVFTTSC